MKINKFKTKLSAIKRFCRYALHYRDMLKMQHIANIKVEGEDEYRRYWGRFTQLVEPYSYRLFSHYCGRTKYIIPEDIGHSYIEALFNPRGKTAYWEDKSLFPTYLPEGCAPQTILCRQDGGEILDGKFVRVATIDFSSNAAQIASCMARIAWGGVILKPSKGSSSGRGIMLFRYNESKNEYVSTTNQVLNGTFLKLYRDNWVLQEVVEQHPYLAQFCHSSLNTMRIFTYRSVANEEIIITSAALRIGHEGSIVDNMHAGGGMVGIDVKSGELGKYVFDQYGNKTTRLNTINFLESTFIIPEWEKILDFSKDVASINTDCRLIALDIALDKNNNPRFIEWNVGGMGYSFWISMMTGVTPFGEKTDEIVEYCLKHRKI